MFPVPAVNVTSALRDFTRTLLRETGIFRHSGRPTDARRPTANRLDPIADDRRAEWRNMPASASCRGA
jgi:hypothetical protein